MLRAIREEQLRDNNGKLDVYVFMRSAEICEHMRWHESFEVEEKVYIIVKSMNPFEVKLEALKILSEESGISKREKKFVLGVISYAERLLQELSAPEQMAILEVSGGNVIDREGLNSFEVSQNDCSYTDCFASYGELVEKCERYFKEDMDPLCRMEIDLVYQGLLNNENNQISYSATWFDGKLQIYAISAQPQWGMKHGFSEMVTDCFWVGRMINRYSLPFQNKSRVELMTPFMKEPLVGMINSSMDGNGCWYHFFYPDDTGEMIDEYLDLSYHMFGLGLEFSVFDWISSSKK